MELNKQLSIVILALIICSLLPQGVGGVYSRTVKICAPAVARTADGYVGVITEITVTVTNGSGEVYASTVPLTEIDMQASIRTAALIACQLTGRNFSDYNFYVKVSSPSLIIGGPSAGAEITIAIASALEGWEINSSVMMSGMINPDETIGPVGGIPEKLKAAADFGVKLFLIPLGQRYFTRYEVVEERVGPFIIRRSRPVTMDLIEYGNELGVKVLEIGDIREAIYHFTGYYIPIGNYTEPPKLTEDISSALEFQYSDLSSKAKEELGKARELISDLKESYRKELDKILRGAEELLIRAGKLALDRAYYSASSVTFQALIQIQYVENLAHYLAGRPLDDIVDEAKKRVKNAEETINETVIDHVNALELVIAAKWRIKDAHRALERAANYYAKDEIAASLRELAYAKWRAETATSWAKLAKLISPGLGFNEDKLRSVLDNYMYNAETVITYAQTILSEMGYSSDELEEAIKYLEEAKEDYGNGDLILALSEAMHSLVYASTSMALIPTSENTISYQVDYSRRKALDSMWRVAGSNLRSILGHAYYEYASIIDERSSRLIMYKLSSAYSTLLTLISGKSKVAPILTTSPGVRPSPTPTKGPIQKVGEIFGMTYLMWIIFALIVGICIGVLIGLWYRSS